MMQTDLTVVEQIVEITKNQIDPQYISTVGEMNAFLDQDDKHCIVAIVGDSSDEVELQVVGEDISRDSSAFVAGYLIAGSYEYDEYADYLNVPIETWLDEVGVLSADDFPIFLSQAFAVRDGYQSNGIGSKLTQYCAMNLTHPPIVAGLWERETDTRNVKVASQYLDFACRFEDYYPDSWSCDACTGSCSCSTVFYIRKQGF